MPALHSILYDKVIPWSQNNLEQRLIIARSSMREASLPPGVELSRKKMTGKRILVRTREDGPQKIVRARWPEAGLHELYIPKLVCVLKGRTDYRAGENIISCGEGYFILLPPHIPNLTGAHPHLEGKHRQYGACDLLQFILYRDHIDCMTCCSRGEKHWDESKHTIAHPLAISLLTFFLEEALHDQAGRDLLCAPLLTSALILLWREIKEGRSNKNIHTLITGKSTFNEGGMASISDYIKTHLHQSPTIETVAQAMYMSPSQLTRHIRQETGKTFVEILTERRLEEAKCLLRETDWSIAAIARHIGFKSSTYFITFFGKQTGCSPGEYRHSQNDRKS